MSELQKSEAAGAPAWVRRPWCLRLGVALVLLGAALNLSYLFNKCPLDLGEDESHYWEWSRHLDYGYYSKPPGIAWAIRGGTELARLAGMKMDDGVALMPWVRLPAVVFGLITGLMLLALARRVFRDDRVGLAAVVLSGTVPMFVVGGLLITIDSPMYMCWVLSMWALWRYVEEPRNENREKRNVGWLYLAGAFCGVGMLFKPVLIALPLCAVVAAGMDRGIRARLKTWHSAGAVVLVLASQVPGIVWNAQHDWVTFKHIWQQNAMGGVAITLGQRMAQLPLRVGEYIGGQAGVLGGILGVLLVLAIVHAVRERRSAGEAVRLRWSFLLAFGLPLWLFYLALSLWSKTEPNWPAASYAAGMILLAGVVTHFWNERAAAGSKAWRQWTMIAVVWGVVLASAALNLHRLYPYLAGQKEGSRWHPRRWDPSMRLRGFAERGRVIGEIVADWERQTGKRPEVVTGRYGVSSSLAFYLPGQPFVYCIMSQIGGRMNQYDLWHPLCAKENAGANVLLVGEVNADMLEKVIRPAFESLEQDEKGKPKYEEYPVMYERVDVRPVKVLRCYGFKGWPVGAGAGRY